MNRVPVITIWWVTELGRVSLWKDGSVIFANFLNICRIPRIIDIYTTRSTKKRIPGIWSNTNKRLILLLPVSCATSGYLLRLFSSLTLNKSVSLWYFALPSDFLCEGQEFFAITLDMFSIWARCLPFVHTALYNCHLGFQLIYPFQDSIQQACPLRSLYTHNRSCAPRN